MNRPVRHLGTIQQRQRMCANKRRYSDVPAARAHGLLSLEHTGDTETKLYVYRCKLCFGYHLTRSRQHGQEPIMLAMREAA